MLYASFDESDVNTYVMTIYGDMDNENEYVVNQHIAYPKVNSTCIQLVYICMCNRISQDASIIHVFQG